MVFEVGLRPAILLSIVESELAGWNDPEPEMRA